MNGDEELMLSHCIRLIILENQLIYFSGTFSPFTKEIGTRNLSAQMSRLENLIERENSIIYSISLKMAVDFM
ncbi:hypothetical protein MACH08_19220 [Oceanobacillus kimchii]|uniref:Uncharacterized protein n=1 Tax=Oceanobacillus kimchii TaxID=746691 RepID=A0ABQ5TGY9_9BACI|nr:hypothetical protein MACH08_19220 [Oceanobacillus kimchii]